MYQASVSLIQNQEQGAMGYTAMMVGFFVVITGKWYLLQKQLAFVRYATGFSPTLDDALAYLKKRKWAILGMSTLCGFIFVAVFMLWTLEIIAAGVLVKVLPGPALAAIIFGVVGFVISFVFIIIAFLLSLTALSCEPGNVTALLSRGFTLSSKSFFRTLFIGFVAAVTVNLIATPLWMPVMFIGAIDTVRTGGMQSGVLPIHWQVVIAAWETLVEMVTQPILFLAYGFYYYDLRLRYEGIDVVETLDALKLKQQALLDMR